MIHQSATVGGHSGGSRFTLSLLERDDFVYDSKPTCRAVVTVRALQTSLTFAYFGRLQRAFYAEGCDTTRADEIARLAVECGVEDAAFKRTFVAEETRLAASADFQLCPRLGVNEFPSVVLQDGTRYAYLTCDHRPFDQIRPVLDAWVGELALK